MKFKTFLIILMLFLYNFILSVEFTGVMDAQ